MKCTSCGNVIKDGEIFCTLCGTSVPKVDYPIQQPQCHQPQKNDNKIWIPIVIIGVFLIAVIVIAVCAGLFMKSKKTDVSVTETTEQETADLTKDEASVEVTADDTLDMDQIIEDVLGVKKLEETVFNLAYSCQKDAEGYNTYALSAPNVSGYINYQYLDFDGDEENELLVVMLESEDEETFLTLHMLEGNGNNEWTLSDSVSKYEEEYMTQTSWMLCPERCDIYLGQTAESPVIYVECEKVASYFTDGVGIDLYQLAYKDGAFQFTLEPVNMSGSDVDYILRLNREEATVRDEIEYFEKFKEKFDKYGLNVTDGMYYDTPLFSQNDNLTYVAGYNKYATFSSDVFFDWTSGGSSGTLEGVVFEALDSYQKVSDPTEETETSSVPAAEWKSAYYDYLLSKDLSPYVGYSLLYVNDDTIPELYLYGDCEATGQIYATYSNGQVNEVYLGRLYSEYGEKQNVVVSSDGHMGYYYDIIYTIENGTFTQVHDGSYYEMYDGGGNIVLDSEGYPLMEYVWDGETVSMQEYQKRLSDAVGTMNLIKPQIQYRSSGDMIKALQGASANANDSEYIFPESSTSYLSETQVAALTKDELRLARNEIYARHGYIFTKEDLKAYFQSKSWYVGTTTETISDEFLNEYEIANRDLIAKYEKQ